MMLARRYRGGRRLALYRKPRPHQANETRPTPRPHFTHLHRDAHRDADAGIASVVEVVSIVDIADIDLVIVVPVVAPVGRPRVNNAQPVALVLETRISADHQEGKALDAKSVIRSEIAAKAVVRDPVAVITAALLPGAVVRLPVSCPMLLPRSLLNMLLRPALLRADRGPLLPAVLLLGADRRILPLRSLTLLRLGPPRRRFCLLPCRLLIPSRWP
jgi:hypothetical protein